MDSWNFHDILNLHFSTLFHKMNFSQCFALLQHSDLAKAYFKVLQLGDEREMTWGMLKIPKQCSKTLKLSSAFKRTFIKYLPVPAYRWAVLTTMLRISLSCLWPGNHEKNYVTSCRSQRISAFKFPYVIKSTVVIQRTCQSMPVVLRGELKILEYWNRPLLCDYN